MKSVLLYAFAVLFAGIATTLLVVNRHAPSMSVLAFAGASYFVALFLAAPADAKAALAALGPYLPVKHSTDGANGGQTP